MVTFGCHWIIISFFVFLADTASDMSVSHASHICRQVTCDKMGITSPQRHQCLRILQDIAHAPDELILCWHFRKMSSDVLEYGVHYYADKFITFAEHLVMMVLIKGCVDKLTYDE